MSERCAFLVDNLDLPTAAGVGDAAWEPFQLEFFNNDSILSIENKSRQIAWSFSAAAEAVAMAILEQQPALFISINLEEAAEKIRYAKAIYENLQLRGLPRIVRDNQSMLELDNGARLISAPGRPPRGKARFNVYLDEYAHVQYDREIYTAMFPIISKGGRIRIGSSPMGASGVFWEVFTQELRPYPDYHRTTTPWWECRSFCTNTATARQVAPRMTTAARVAEFGNARIKLIYANSIEEDFQQEYECMFVDETTAWITWDEIRRNQNPKHVWWHATSTEQAIQMLPAVLHAIEQGQIEPALVGGLDIGRSRDLTELLLGGQTTTGHVPVRFSVSLGNVEYAAQEACFLEILNRLPVVKMLVDQTGIGGQLAEALARTGRAEGVTFTNPLKALWATNARIMAQRSRAPLPADRDLAYQIHSIKKTVSDSKHFIFDSDRSEKHHADKFWAWALMLAAADAGPGAAAAEPVNFSSDNFKPQRRSKCPNNRNNRR